MQFFFFSAFDCFAAIFFLYLFLHFRDHRRRGGLPYPPGPPSWPIIRNLLDYPKVLPWRQFADMSKKYGKFNILVVPGYPFVPAEPPLQGDVICLRIYPRDVIVLNSSSAIKDLLEKRSQIYSERVYFPTLRMYVCHGSILVSQLTAMSTILDLQDEFGLVARHERND
jgi:hypothetical protein